MTVEAAKRNAQEAPGRYLIAADTGGTFTDLAVYDLRPVRQGSERR